MSLFFHLEKRSRSDLENDGEVEDEDFAALTPADKMPHMDYQPASSPRRVFSIPSHIWT